MKATICLICHADMSIEDIARRAAEMRLNAVELSLSSADLIRLGTNEADCRAVCDILSRFSARPAAIRILDTGTACFASPSSRHRDETTSLLQSALHVGRLWNAETIVVPAGVFRREGEPQLALDAAYMAMLDGFASLRFDAMHCGVTLNCDFCHPAAFPSIPELREFIDRINSPFVGVALTTPKSELKGDHKPGLDQLGHRVRHLTIRNDSNSPDGIVRALRRHEFEGVLSVDEEMATMIRDRMEKSNLLT